MTRYISKYLIGIILVGIFLFAAGAIDGAINQDKSTISTNGTEPPSFDGGLTIESAMPYPPTFNDYNVSEIVNDITYSGFNQIYQYGYSEAGLFYSVSDGTTNESRGELQAINFTLSEDYHEYWNISYISFYNQTGVIKPEFNDKFLNTTTQTIDIDIDVNPYVLNTTQQFDIGISNITSFTVHFDAMNLDTDDTLRLYNSSMDQVWSTAVDFTGDVPVTLPNGTFFICVDGNGGNGDYSIDTVECQGTIFTSNQETTLVMVKADPVLKARIHFVDIDLGTYTGLDVSDVWGTTIQTLGAGPATSMWFDPNYVVLNFTGGAAVDGSFQIGEIEYNVTQGWERIYAADAQAFIDYAAGSESLLLNVTDFNQHYGGSWQDACTSWSLIFDKRPVDVGIELLDDGGQPVADNVMVLGEEYTLNLTAVDSVNGDWIDAKNIDGMQNTVRIQVSQDEAFIYEASTTLVDGSALFEFNSTELLDLLYAGPLVLTGFVSNVNYGAFDNTTAEAGMSLFFYEVPSMVFNRMSSEVIGTVLGNQATTTAGTLYDPNEILFNVTAYDAWGNSETMNGQEIQVNVKHESSTVHTETIYQNYYAENDANFAFFTHVCDKVGTWTVEFTLTDTEYGKPSGYFLDANTVSATVNVVPREMVLDIYTDSDGIRPEKVSRVYVEVTDEEEEDFPLYGWSVDLYFIRNMGTFYKQYYITTTTTNETGVANFIWVPPRDLAGEDFWLAAEVFTPAEEIDRYVPSDRLIKFGFHFERIETYVVIEADRDESTTYNHIEQMTYSARLYNQFGEELIGEPIIFNATDGSDTFKLPLEYPINLITGFDNTNNIFSPGAVWTGLGHFYIEYKGNQQYAPSSCHTTRRWVKSDTAMEIIVDRFGFSFQPGESVPITVKAWSNFTGETFTSTVGSINVTIEDEFSSFEFFSLGITEAQGGSSRTIENWTPDQSGWYTITAELVDTQWYKPCSANVTVLINRAELDMEVTILPIKAGEDLTFTVQLDYKDGRPVSYVPIIFEYTDVLGNMYILNNETVITEADGICEYSYQYNDDDFIYMYMVEFGGTLRATTLRNLTLESSSVEIKDFKIEKAPSDINITITGPSYDPGVELEINIALLNDFNILDQQLFVEIFSNEGYSEMQNVTTGTSNTIFWTIPETGIYYIKATYKGSHILDPDADIAIIMTSDYAVNDVHPVVTALETIYKQTDDILIYVAIIVLAIVVVMFVRTRIKLNTQRKVEGSLVAIFVAFAFLFTETLPIINSVPSTIDVQANAVSQSGEDYDLFAADLERALTGDDVQTRSSGSGSGSEVTADLGSFGQIQMPIGDTLNLTFNTPVDNDVAYVVAIEAIIGNRRVATMYGKASQDTRETMMIQITDEMFFVGGEYRVKLLVFPQDSWTMTYAESRSIQFVVVPGFSDLELQMQDTLVGDDVLFSATLTEDFSGKPMINKRVDFFEINDETSAYEYVASAFTDAVGVATTKVSHAAVQGEYSIMARYQGDSAHYKATSDDDLVIEPIVTYLSVGTSPVEYSDNGTITALIYDTYGNELENKDIIYEIYLDNLTLEGSPLVFIDTWVELGKVTTNADGIANLVFPAKFPVGEYMIRVQFEGDDIYKQILIEEPLLVIEKETIEMSNLEFEGTYGSASYFTITLTDNDGTPVFNKSLEFAVYHDHDWHHAATSYSNSEGTVIVEYTPLAKEGTYLVRASTSEDDHYGLTMKYGSINVSAATPAINVKLCSGDYHTDIPISARLTVWNQTQVMPAVGKSLLFYIETDVAGAGTEFVYIGSALTDDDGWATLDWYADLIPADYAIKVAYPGNLGEEIGYNETVIDAGLQIRRARANLQLDTMPQVPIMSFSDTSLNLTGLTGVPIHNQTVNIKITPKGDPSEVVVERNVLTDANGIAKFRWCPGTLGNFTFTATLDNGYYAKMQSQVNIQVVRAAIVFNASISNTQTHRGDTISITGNASFVYIHYNGTQELIPAPAVPLRFYITNESLFTHPVSGFQVPNVPLKDTDDLVFTQSGSQAANIGQFSWEFIMPDEAYGLQAGRYFLRIKVDSTKTGFFDGYADISFDLIECTSMQVFVDRSDNATARQQAGLISTDWDYFVNEKETIRIVLVDEDGVYLQETNEFGATYRDLQVLLDDELFYLELDTSNTLTMHRNTMYGPDVTSDYNAFFNPGTATYTITYAPNPGRAGSMIFTATFLGDRFFDANDAQNTTTVHLRPINVTLWMDDINDLYRQNVPYDYLDTNATLTVYAYDILSTVPLDSHQITFYLHDVVADNKLSGRKHLSPVDTTTDVNGNTIENWDVPSWVQAGHHSMEAYAPATPIYAANMSLVELHTWELTSISISATTLKQGYKAVYILKDQDGKLIDAEVINSEISVPVSAEEDLVGEREISESSTFNGKVIQEFSAELKGTYSILAEFLGNNETCLRGSVASIMGALKGGSLFATTGLLDHVSTTKAVVDQGKAPYAVNVDGAYYFTISEARIYLNTAADSISVYTNDTNTFIPAIDAYYVRTQSDNELPIPYPGKLGTGMIIAYEDKAAAEAYIASEWNRLEDMVFQFLEDPSDKSAVTLPELIRYGEVWSVANVGQDLQLPTPTGKAKNGFQTALSAIGAAFNNIANSIKNFQMKRIYSLMFEIIGIICSGGYWTEDTEAVPLFNSATGMYEYPPGSKTHNLMTDNNGNFGLNLLEYFDYLFGAILIDAYAKAIEGILSTKPASTNKVGEKNPYKTLKTAFGSAKKLKKAINDVIADNGWKPNTISGIVQLFAHPWLLGTVLMKCNFALSLKSLVTYMKFTWSQFPEILVLTLMGTMREFYPGWGFVAKHEAEMMYDYRYKGQLVNRKAYSKWNIFSTFFNRIKPSGKGTLFDEGLLKAELITLAFPIIGGLLKTLLGVFPDNPFTSPVIGLVNKLESWAGKALKDFLFEAKYQQIYKRVASGDGISRIFKMGSSLVSGVIGDLIDIIFDIIESVCKKSGIISGWPEWLKWIVFTLLRIILKFVLGAILSPAGLTTGAILKFLQKMFMMVLNEMILPWVLQSLVMPLLSNLFPGAATWLF